MKMIESVSKAGVMMLLMGVLVLLFPEGAVAGDPGWRPTYDVAMRWINFIILVAVIVKYAREPISDFLEMKKDEVVSKIEKLEKQKSRILDDIQVAKQQAADNQARFKELKARMIAQGETRKRQIIEQAKQQSTVMLEETRRKMENRIVQAKASLKMELLDLAIEQAVVKLPGLMTDGDNQRLLDDYMQHIHTRPPTQNVQ